MGNSNKREVVLTISGLKDFGREKKGTIRGLPLSGSRAGDVQDSLSPGGGIARFVRIFCR